MNIKKISMQAEQQGMLLRYDRKLRKWCLIDIQYNAQIAQFDTPDEAAAWLSE